MFKKVTFYKEVLLANWRLGLGKSEFHGDYFEGIPVIVSNDIVQAVGSKYAGAGRDGLDRPTIFVDDAFFNLPRHVQLFVIYHEFGHIHLGHVPERNFKTILKKGLANSVRNYRTLVGKVEQNELDADKFAAETMGNYQQAILALEYLMNDTIKTFGKGLHLNEFRLRIKALKESSK